MPIYSVDLSLVISLAALAFSLLSPILSAVINGHFRIKEKKMENKQVLAAQRLAYFDQHRAEVIERFISSAGAAIKLTTNDAQISFGASVGEIYLYVDKSLWPLIDSINDCLQRFDREQANVHFKEFCKAISTQHVRSINEH